MNQLLLVLAVALTVGAIVFGVIALLGEDDKGLQPVEPDGRALPLPSSRPLVESDVADVRFDTAWRGYRMAQVDAALQRLAYDIGYKDELIKVLHAEVDALREGRFPDAEVLRRAREAALAQVETTAAPAPAAAIPADRAPVAVPADDTPTAVAPAAVAPPAGAPVADAPVAEAADAPVDLPVAAPADEQQPPHRSAGEEPATDESTPDTPAGNGPGAARDADEPGPAEPGAGEPGAEEPAAEDVTAEDVTDAGAEQTSAAEPAAAETAGGPAPAPPTTGQTALTSRQR